MAALLVTPSFAQSQLHSQGSRGSDRHRWREVVDTHDESFCSCARVATLEQQPAEGEWVVFEIIKVKFNSGSAEGTLTQNGCPL